MDFVLPPRQLFFTSRSYHYSYIHITGASNRGTLLLIHGFPSHIDDWIHQIRYFESRGYGLLVPDMLGYGESSAPAEADAYRLKLISQDLAELLDHAQLEQVVGVGHDWGVTILSRLAIYHPRRLKALALLGIGAPKPGTTFDLDGINSMAKEATGSEMLGYVTYISRDPESHQMMEEHAESVMEIMFASDSQSWGLHLHPSGGFKSFVEGGFRQPVGTWFVEELRRRHLEAFRRPNGYRGPSCYYKMLDLNLSVSDEVEFANFIIEQPQMLSVWASDVVTLRVNSGHWIHLERGDETSQALERLL
ncbi:Alpha/Beta hydrolase protein [Truncatella angustata]|uniref:Alpha/Beta hydrolase protein n=1 Tax=Truncatella angustata TaxID=152316 RepID=A0A9P8RED3_9PEZI|nr:Alpha/Beta hydrolase protein [Truncatella angustata]KAH6639918.1 Alpha/Beta hydrolase protein [Truncatella angustata]